MFGIGSTELLIILVVALVLIGPQKLPDLMKSVGKGLSEFRRMSSDVKSTLEREIEKADEAKRIEETKKELFGDDADKPTEVSEASAEPAKKNEPAPAPAAETPKAETPVAAQPSGTPAASDVAKAEQPASSQTVAGTAPQTGAKTVSQSQDKTHA